MPPMKKYGVLDLISVNSKANYVKQIGIIKIQANHELNSVPNIKTLIGTL